MSVAIQLEGLTKRFGQTTAVDGVDLRIEPGELFFLLGPSGCGKTTLLRMLAGLEEPSGGRIRFGERDVTRAAPNKRNIGMVFQSYALWPHMTVAENVAFGLRVRKVSGDERQRRVREALRAVRMQDYAQRRPGQLSGGQQQRVALARALVISPDVLLLDEPLSNLDAALRLEMRHEIKRLCAQTEVTSVYVTHDQHEALSMADRIAVMREGRIEQVGAPRDLYDRPGSRFVAGFLGETNFVPAEIVERDNGDVTLDSPAGRLRALIEEANHIPNKGSITCSIRPEAIELRPGDDDDNHLTGRILETMYLGSAAQRLIELPGEVVVKVLDPNPPRRDPEGEINVSIDPRQVVLLAD